jgi:xanthine dehydrogenase YagS FAD-binding subunit
MHPFAYRAAASLQDAVAHGAGQPAAMFIAGGTDLLQLLQENVAAPSEVIDINCLPFAGIEADDAGLRIGALVRMSDLARHRAVQERYPVIAEALLASASGQVRNAATIGGNLLQRTRCLYFRDHTTPCNRREPGSGCGAMEGINRLNAIFGTSPHCIATHASDLAVALVALDARLRLAGPDGEREIGLAELHREPGDTPEIETVLKRGELILEIIVPASAVAAHSTYLKVRDRASFEWALVSAAAALEVADGKIRSARVAAGGVGTKPWRLQQVEDALVGLPPTFESAQAAAERAGEGANPRPGNAFKVELLQRTVACAIASAGARA